MNRKPWILGLSALVIALVAFGLVRHNSRRPAAQAPHPVVVQIAPAARGPIAETTELSGTLQAARRVELSAELPSRVRRVPVKEGDHVAAGQLLVQLDDAEIQGNIARATAGVAAARAQVTKARLGQMAARTAATAQLGKARSGAAAARAQADQAVMGVGLTAAQAANDVAQARGAVKAAEANAAQARRAVDLARAQADSDLAQAAAGVKAAEADVQRASTGGSVSGEAAQADLERARAGLAAAQANLSRVRAGAGVDAIAAAQAQVEQARIGRDEAKRQVDDLEYLFKNGGVSGDTLAGARTQLKITEQQVAAAEAQLRQAQRGASAGEVAAAQAQVAEAEAGVRAAEAGRGRSKVSTAEVAAAEAQLERARAGWQAARDTRQDRIGVAEQQAAAAAAQLEQARAGLQAAQAAQGRVAVGQAGVRAADANVAMARAGEAEAAVARQQANALSADIAAAQAGLIEAEAQQRLAAQQLQRTALTAPVGGVVTQLSVHAGDTIMPGMPMVVIETADATELEALASTEQRLALAAGQAAQVRVEGSDRVYPGTVTSVAKVAEPDGRSFKVRILIANRDLPPGVHASAQVSTSVERAALEVPAAAVQDAEGKAPFVFVRQGRTAVRRPVTLGLKTPDRIQILEGLNEGEQVITEGARVLFDGALIEVRGE